MTAGSLDAWLERAIAILVLLALTFASLATGAVRPLDFQLIQVLVSLALILWIARFWIGGSHRVLFAPFCWTILAFLCLAAVRYLQADLEHVARYECLRILVYASLFLLVLNNLQSEETIQWIVLFLVGLATLVSFYAIYQTATRSEFVWHFVKPAQYAGRGTGTFICPNHLAGFLELVLPLGLACIFAGRYRHTFKIVLGYGCLVILAGIAVTGSRGGWVATALSLLVLFILLLRRRQYRIPALAALGLALLAGVMVTSFSEPIRKRLERISISDARHDARPGIWTAAWRMWLDAPILGVGPDHFDHHFHRYRPESIQERPGRVHNDYLNTLVDWGIAGAGIAGAGAGLLLWGLIRTRKYLERNSRDLGAWRNSNRNAYLLGTFGAASAIAVHSFFDFNLHVPANAMILVTILAMAASHLRFLSSRFWTHDTLLSRGAVTLAAGTACCILLCTAWGGVREQWLLEEARTLPELSEERLQKLRSASEREPGNFRTHYRIAEALRMKGFAASEGAQPLLREAIEHYELVRSIHPGHAMSAVGIGMALDRLGHIAQATGYYREALDLDPRQHRIHTFMGWHQINLGNYPEAIEHFERSLEIKWWDNHTPRHYLDVLEQLGDGPDHQF